MTEDDTATFLWLGRLVWIGIILAAIAFIVLVGWGLCATAAAVGRGEAWAHWVAGGLFLVVLVVVLREINR